MIPNFFLKKIHLSLYRGSLRRKTIIHRNQHRNHIQEVAQVGAVGLLEEVEAEEVGIALAVVDGDSVLREALVPTIHP